MLCKHGNALINRTNPPQKSTISCGVEGETACYDGLDLQCPICQLQFIENYLMPKQKETD